MKNIRNIKNVLPTVLLFQTPFLCLKSLVIGTPFDDGHCETIKYNVEGDLYDTIALKRYTHNLALEGTLDSQILIKEIKNAKFDWKLEFLRALFQHVCFSGPKFIHSVEFCGKNKNLQICMRTLLVKTTCRTKISSTIFSQGEILKRKTNSC